MINIKKDNLYEKTIQINRVSKVVRGRRVMSFSVLVVVGDKNGKIGIGKSKSKEIILATNKAVFKACKSIKKIPLKNNTLYYKIIGKFNSSFVYMSPAREGTGIIAGKVLRSLFYVIGINNIISKSIGSKNPHNVIKAAINGLLDIDTPKEISKRRNKLLKNIL